MNDFYVYVYIDPRNHEEFYYGKGTDRRKEHHLSDTSDTEKVERIKAIKEEGCTPIIRVIARGLTNDQALLVEKTLLWKLGKSLTNIATGSFAENFRPQNKLHLVLSGFDYVQGIYYFNIGEGPHRRWSDCKKHGFISAGQGPKWRDSICGFREGDIFAAYLKQQGFVGVGRITRPAEPIRKVMIQNRPLLDHQLDCGNMADNIDSQENCEYVALVEWISAVESQKAKWRAKAGLYTTTHVRASLEGQPATMAFLEKEFGVNLQELRDRREP